MNWVILTVLAVYVFSLIWMFVFAERVARWLDKADQVGESE